MPEPSTEGHNGQLLGAMEPGTDLYTPDSPLPLRDAERTEMRRLLDGEIYSVIRIRKYILLRLDNVFSTGGVAYEYPHISVEHGLPQTPDHDSEWRSLFNDEERGYWTHRLANLVLLTHRKNSQAQNYEFDTRKQRYFTMKTGDGSPVVLTTQVLGQSEWTPAVLPERQHRLTSALSELWRLE